MLDKRGAVLDAARGATVPHGYWFGEDQARYVVTVRDADLLGVLSKLKSVEVPCVQLGKTGGDAIAVAGEQPVKIEKLRHAFERWLPDYMAGKN